LLSSWGKAGKKGTSIASTRMPGKKKKYNARFPPARIKKIMQSDEEVGKVAAPVPVIISRALEMFAETLLGSAKQVTAQRGARTLTPSHLKFCIQSEARFDFLRDLVSSVPDLQGDVDSIEASPAPVSPFGAAVDAGQAAIRGRGGPGRGSVLGVRGGGTGRRRGRPPKVHDPSIIPGAKPKKTVAERLYIDDEYDCEELEGEEEEEKEDRMGAPSNGWASRLTSGQAISPAASSAALASHPYARSLSLPQQASSGLPPAHNHHHHHHHSFSSPFDIQRSVSISNQDYYLHYGAYRGGHLPRPPYGRPILPRPPPLPPATPPSHSQAPVPGLTAFYKEREEDVEERPSQPPATNGSFRIGPVAAGGEEVQAGEAAPKRVEMSLASPELTKILPPLVPGQPAGGGPATVDEDYDC